MAEKKEENIQDDDQQSPPVPLEWNVPEGLITPFVSNMTIQKIDSGLFQILFFQAKPPLRLDKSEPMPAKIRADCVASIIVTADRLSTFMEVFQKQLDLVKGKDK